MAKEPVFYSFHFDNDVHRVQLIRNMGTLDGDEPASPNDWEKIKRNGDSAVEKWIDDNMKYRRCVIVLIGSETANRPWVKYEIKKAWMEKRGLFGVYIHNLKCMRNGLCKKGSNPFSQWSVNKNPMSNLIKCYDPNSADAYGEISRNLQTWVSTAIADAKKR